MACMCVCGGYDASQCMWMKVKIILINVAFSIKIGISETILCTISINHLDWGHVAIAHHMTLSMPTYLG